VPPGRGIGGLIEIHGAGGQGRNWTDGCVALVNPDMDRLFAAVGVGTPVTIVGRAHLPAPAGGTP
jgi:lipoprotein-anchoring transpeptidase ErfK/SrfK